MKTENESQTTNESSERANRAKDLVRMLYDAVAATDDLERENLDLNCRLRAANLERAEMDRRLRVAEATLNTLAVDTSKMACLEDSLRQARAALAEAQKESADLRQKMNDMLVPESAGFHTAKIRTEQLDKELKASEDTLRTTREALANAEKELAGSRDSNRRLRADLDKAKAEMDELRQKMEAGLVCCHDDHEFSKSALAASQAVADGLRLSLVNAEKRASHLQIVADGFRAKIEELEKRHPCNDCARESKKYRQIANDLQTRVEVAEKQAADLQMVADSFRGKLEMEQDRNIALLEKLETAEERTDGLLQRIAAYELRLDVGPFGDKVATEILRARSLHKPINSTHEGYSVLLEEVEEFWEEVRKKRKDRDRSKMLDELVQVGAMAQRIAEDCLGSPVVVKGKE